MREKISFERYLFGDENEITIEDVGFVVDRLIKLPQIRPHKLEQAITLSMEYSQNSDFVEKMIEKANDCPVLIYKLQMKEVITIEEILPFLRFRGTFILCHYFRKFIFDFDGLITNKKKPEEFDESFFQNSKHFDNLIEYGYLPSSIEYCLKYDDIDGFLNIHTLKREAIWSPFEWANKPKYLDLLSFSGYFSSINCFKHLLMNGYEINQKVISMVICSGCFDLYHLCKGEGSLTIENIFNVSEFCHLSLLEHMIENGADINAKNISILVRVLRMLHFILLPYMVIFALLITYLVKKPI